MIFNVTLEVTSSVHISTTDLSIMMTTHAAGGTSSSAMVPIGLRNCSNNTMVTCHEVVHWHRDEDRYRYKLG